MKKGQKIAFWIIFPLVSLFITLFLVFYFDLINTPIIFFILEMVILGLAIILRIILRNKKFAIRMMPTLTWFIATTIIVPFAMQPISVDKSAAYYKNPIKTEVMHIENGDIQGIYNKDQSVRIYAGLPYAKAPIGDLRWKEPQNVEDWSGVRDCSYFASKSMQPSNNALTSTLADIYASKGWYPDYTFHPEQKMSEDSLYLNIWRPNNDKKDLPVLVFIHGGSLTTGSSAYEDYNGEEMAKKDVIMVTITYRLGVFGYFAHPDLINESENKTTGNYGLLDQIKALEWVNENIPYFGGDASNITIAGESAGSSSVSALCSSPLATGLFTRAIGESSSLVVKKAPHTYRKLDKALETGEKIMKEFNCSSIEELRKVSAKKLVNTSYTNDSMTLDGYALTKDPYQVYLDKENNETALLNGYNVKEADAFVIPKFLLSPTNKNNIKARLAEDFGEDIASKMCEIYKEEINKDAFSVFNEIYSTYWFVYPHHSWSNMASINNVPVYRYQFTKENKYHGTFHAGEMIYAYGNVKNSSYKYRYNQSDRDLSEMMLNYWANFAKTGNPNGDNLPKWEENKVMELGSNVGPIEDKYLKLYPIIEEFMDKQINKESEN